MVCLRVKIYCSLFKVGDWVTIRMIVHDQMSKERNRVWSGTKNNVIISDQ
jgi:hypothetical protein